jgi:hypothetical protein
VFAAGLAYRVIGVIVGKQNSVLNNCTPKFLFAVSLILLGE